MQQEEGEVDQEEDEAQHHAHPLLQPLPWAHSSTALEELGCDMNLAI